MHISRIKSCILFTSCLPWALSAGGSLWLFVSYTHTVSYGLFSCQWKTGNFFLTHPFASHNVVFVSFWQFIQTSALWEWQAISQTTERVAAKGNKPGPTLRFSPGWFTSSRDSVSHVLIKISKVVILHLPWLSGATIQTTYTKRPHFLSHEMLKSPSPKKLLVLLDFRAPARRSFRYPPQSTFSDSQRSNPNKADNSCIGINAVGWEGSCLLLWFNSLPVGWQQERFFNCMHKWSLSLKRSFSL